MGLWGALVGGCVGVGCGGGWDGKVRQLGKCLGFRWVYIPRGARWAGAAGGAGCPSWAWGLFLFFQFLFSILCYLFSVSILVLFYFSELKYLQK